ncbi:hypothetical protein M422DRAFT_265215 [Sphaerobolus stellatus SS14]|uniref:Uncharacterized protein n=1 Tax=Sphaerobolus stellatus (strain SS14) TaxID=990650 RepID=A0A0C9TRU4_SPHS4|nr:hypothetical protein M422DRAFT_265215 [Sphaerobolus stellatus SS14]
MDAPTVYEHFASIFVDIAGIIFDPLGFPPAQLDFWKWDRETVLEDSKCQDLRLAAEWVGSWLEAYETRIKLVSALRLTSRIFFLAVEPFFLSQLWFTHPTQIHAFLKAFPPSHPLLPTARRLRIDIPLAVNLPWKDIPYTANGWPRERRFDLYWPSPPDKRTAIYGILECQTLYWQLLNRLTHVVSFDTGMHNTSGLSAHPPPPQYLRTSSVNRLKKSGHVQAVQKRPDIS